MKLYELKRTQQLPISVATAWDFFSDPRNLIKITPPEMKLSPTNDIPERMYPGMIVTYNVQLAPFISQTWVTEITQVQEPHFFIDEQRFGPYRFWHHQHHLKEAQGGVEMTDLIHYALPFDPLSRWAVPLLIKPQLERIFSYRKTALEHLFPAR